MKLHFRSSFTAILIFCAASIGGKCDEKVYENAVRVTTLLKVSEDAAGKKIVYPTGEAEITAVLVEFPVGAKTGWHEHTVPCAAYILEGEIQLELKDGKKRIVKAGEAFGEVVDLLHNGTNLGPKPVKLVLFVAGQRDKAYTVKR